MDFVCEMHCKQDFKSNNGSNKQFGFQSVKASDDIGRNKQQFQVPSSMNQNNPGQKYLVSSVASYYESFAYKTKSSVGSSTGNHIYKKNKM